MYDDVAVSLAHRRHGVVATWELREHGVNPDQILLLSRSRHWVRVSSTVLRRTGSPSTTEQAAAAAVLDSGPRAALAYGSAARWWGLTGCRLRPFEVITTSSTRRTAELAERTQVREIPARWVTEHNGVSVVRPEFCALQLFARMHQGRAERLTDRLWSMRLLSSHSLRQCLAELGKRGRNGSAGLRQYLEDRPLDYVPPASGLESRAQQILEDSGIQVRRQVDVGTDEAWTGRVDFEVIGRPVVIEIQSEMYHRSLVDANDDAHRRAQLEAGGFTWVEIWDTEVWADPAAAVHKVRVALDRS